MATYPAVYLLYLLYSYRHNFALSATHFIVNSQIIYSISHFVGAGASARPFRWANRVVGPYSSKRNNFIRNQHTSHFGKLTQQKIHPFGWIFYYSTSSSALIYISSVVSNASCKISAYGLAKGISCKPSNTLSIALQRSVYIF